jgi:hypothetical protein
MRRIAAAVSFERPLPRDFLPTRIGMALRMSPAHGSPQALPAIDKFGYGTALGRSRLPRSGGSDPGQGAQKRPFATRRNTAAAGAAETAIALYRLGFPSLGGLMHPLRYPARHRRPASACLRAQGPMPDKSDEFGLAANAAEPFYSRRSVTRGPCGKGWARGDGQVRAAPLDRPEVSCEAR